MTVRRIMRKETMTAKEQMNKADDDKKWDEEE
jgi:hypothetical protein